MKKRSFSEETFRWGVESLLDVATRPVVVGDERSSAFSWTIP
jgi:hypothetical protein